MTVYRIKEPKSGQGLTKGCRVTVIIIIIIIIIHKYSQINLLSNTTDYILNIAGHLAHIGDKSSAYNFWYKNLNETPCEKLAQLER
jgi:hypothetical protein